MNNKLRDGERYGDMSMYLQLGWTEMDGKTAAFPANNREK
jgi:hypothetical protein